MKKYNIAIVGATGAVGQEMIRMLELRNFPVNNIFYLASARSAGRKLKFRDNEIEVKDLSKFTGIKSKYSIDLALFSAGASISKEYAPKFTAEGVFVIDNSSAWRMDPEIPLVVPEVNSDVLSPRKLLISNPNCSTIQMVVVLGVIHKISRIKRIIVSTYQSVSGAGARAMEQLRYETGEILKQIEKKEVIFNCEQKDYKLSDNKTLKNPAIFYQIGFNLIPQIDIFLENLYTKEEMKMVNETRKILNDNSIMISATCVRVPVFRSHSESVWIETEQKLSIEKVKELLNKTEGIKVIDDIQSSDIFNRYPTPVDCAFQQITYVGRIRQDLSIENGIVMWIVSDNLLKGAALNAVQIAEKLIEKKYL